MGLEVGAVDHDSLRRPCLGGKRGEDAVEHTETAPADEATIQGLVRAIAEGRIAPLQAVADDVDDATQHTSVIHPWDAV